jgi:rubrerythrin
LKLPQIFLKHLAKEQKEFLNLVDTTAKVHGELKPPQANLDIPLWDEKFFHLEKSQIWNDFSPKTKNDILLLLGQKILQEAYFIECAGMAYAAKMNLSAKSREERAFFCFVAEEEAKHLRQIEYLTLFSVSLDDIPSFALLIGEIIQEAKRASHLLLIQILLEGWGLYYYKTLAKTTKDQNVENVFKSILKDEIRHHAGGVLLFASYKNTGIEDQDIDQFLGFLERIAFMVKVGPWSVCEAVFKHAPGSDAEAIKRFLEEIDAVAVTQEKIDVLKNLLLKSVPTSLWSLIEEKKIFTSLNEDEMTEILAQSIL